MIAKTQAKGGGCITLYPIIISSLDDRRVTSVSTEPDIRGEQDFSNSLMIHRVLRKRNHGHVTMFGYLILITIDFTLLFLRFLLSFSRL